MSDGPDEVRLDDIERTLLGARCTLTRLEVAERAGVPIELAEELWAQLGFPRTADDDVAFTERDVAALEMTAELVSEGILESDSQAALVRTWGRSFARLAEWQAELLAGLALQDDHPERRVGELVGSVTPRVGKLQDYVWRRHLVSAAQRLLPAVEADEEGQQLAVAFTDIVGYTSRSKHLSQAELVDLVETFEDETTRAVTAIDGRVIKTIGDEVLYVAESPRALVEVALALTARGEDDDDPFPQVRAGIAYGEVTTRLGDVFGPTVNIASRLTSLARPGTVLVDRGTFDALTGRGEHADDDPDTAPDGTPLSRILDRAADELADISPYAEHEDLKFRRLRRTSVKGYRSLEPWLVRKSRDRRSHPD
ncbi:adenylate/guanylate cyclase domain-containing protein [Nocardioides sp. GXQ0305]|uniref:adenylate/guanylate cyclase domain-containing protein n=1 Tax=Nocardioides sp. GXQ0305 TaxID=3423912 RepID=UPI003D7D67C4